MKPRHPLQGFARELRNNATDVERLLWRHLQYSQLEGVKFRRQQPIDVLRSLSDHPFISEHRELIHKIGVTGGKVESRIANASLDATYLLAEVEVVASYKLAGINRTKLENLFHRIFAPAQIDLTNPDRYGHPVRPREWFLVPLHAIDEAVRRIKDGSITAAVYDPQTAQLVD